MINIYEYKHKYDKIAYLHDPEVKYKVYYRSPTVFEYLRFIENNEAIEIQLECITLCIFAVRSENDEEVDIPLYINSVSETRPAFLEILYSKIIELCPLTNKDECKSIYQIKRQNLYRMINYMKMQFLVVFGDYRLAEDCESFSFSKFMEYVVMVEDITKRHGLFISELLEDDSLMDTETKIAVEQAKKVSEKQRKTKTPFPPSLTPADTSQISDPSLRSALENASLALRNKLVEDSVLAKRGQLKKSFDWESDNAQFEKGGV